MNKILETELTSGNNFFSSREELQSPQSPNIPHTQPDYVLVFKNPKFIPEVKAFPQAQKSKIKNLFILKPKENSTLKKALQSLSENPLKANLSDSDFAELALDTILKVFQDSLGIYTEAFLSSDKSEILILLKFSENNLKVQADLTDYKLQISEESAGLGQSAERLEFQIVLPYAPLEKNIVDINPNAYLKYNKYDQPDKTGSVFRAVDRIRLAKSVLSDTVFFNELYEKGIMVKEFPAHDYLVLLELQSTWADFRSIFRKQPLDLIRNYFGEEIAFYFAFVEMYSRLMLALTVLGAGFFMMILYGGDIYSNSYYMSGFLLASALTQGLLSIFFDQIWVRQENYLKWKWGVDKLSISEEQQHSFKGKRKLDEVSGKIKTINSVKGLGKYLKFMGLGAVLFIFILVISGLISVFFLKDKYKWGVFIGGILNGLQIKLFNQVYKCIATKMTDWENLETNREYFDSLSFKLYSFQFFNSYGCLLYIAFLKNDIEKCFNGNCLEELRSQLLGIFFVNFLTNFAEIGFPFLKNAALLAIGRGKAASFNSGMKNIKEEAVLSDYKTCIYEYMEVAIDLGYVLMFSSAFQVLSLFALLMALVEIRIDAWKICNVTRRPFPKQANTIGIWNQIIQTLSIIGIGVNIGTIVFTFDGFFLKDSDSKWILFIAVEHFLIILKLVISEIIPDQPLVVRQGLLWSGRIVRDKIFHIRSEDEKKRILANKTVDPKHVIEAHHILNELD